MRIGIGYDIHRLVEGRPFVLGGVTLPYPQGPLGHSDGDALLHAIIDALLGAAGLGDIGTLFPPDDKAWEGAQSIELLRLAYEQVQGAGYRVHNVDSTVLLERPKLATHIPQMRAAIAAALLIAPDRVSVKAKTNEGLDAVGRGEAIAAHAVVLLEELVK